MIGTTQDQKVFSDYLNLKIPRNIADSGTPLEDNWAKLDLQKNIDIAGGDMDLELTISNDRFSAAVSVPGNWVFDPGATNLSIASIAKDSDTACTISFEPQEYWAQLAIALDSLHGLAQLSIVKDSADGLAQLAITKDSASSLPQLAIVEDTALHLCQLAISGVALGAADPTITVNITEDTFLSEASCNLINNWTIDMDTANTGLTLGAVTWVNNAQCTISTTGTAAAGTFTLMIESAAMTRGLNSGIGSYEIAAAPVSSCTDASVNPVYAVTLSGDTFISEGRTEETANWVFDMGTSNIVVQSVSWTDATHCKLVTTGIATSTFDASLLAVALTGSYDSGVATYTVATDTSTCTDAAYGVDPVYAVALTADTFDSEAACNLVTNWTFDMSASGLTVASITWLNNASCTIQTTGIALNDSFTAMVEALALTRSYDSGVATYTIATNSSTCTDSLYGVDPVYIVTLSDDEFVSQAACENLANWTFTMGTSGLVATSISWLTSTTCKINTTGIASEVASDSFVAMVEAAALLRARDSGEATYVIDTDSSTCTDVAHELDPVYAVVLSVDIFASEGDCETIGNWTFDWLASGLTALYVDYVDPTNCKIATSGTPSTTRFTVMAKAAALTAAADSGVATYQISSDTSTCTDAVQLVDGIITLRATAAALDAGIFDESVFTLNTATGEHSASSQTSGPNYACESFVARDGYIIDSFTPPVVPGGLQTFPEFVAGSINPDSGTTYTEYVDRFAASDIPAEEVVFCTGATLTNPISAIGYEAISVDTGFALQRGFGFRQFYPDILFDSSAITGFGADLANVAVGSYINITFASPTVVQKVVFDMEAAGCAAKFHLLGSNDGGTWNYVSTELSPMEVSSIGENAHEFANYTAYTRYRFVVQTGAGVGGGKILEIGLFNKPMSTHPTTDLPDLDYIAAADGSLVFNNAVDMAAWSADHPAQELFVKSEPVISWPWNDYNQVGFYFKSNMVGTIGVLTFEISPATTVEQTIVCSVANTWERVRVPITVPGGESVTSISFAPALTQGLTVTVGGPAILNEEFGVRTGSIPQSSSIHSLDMTSPRAYMFYVPDLNDLSFAGYSCEAKYYDGSDFVSSKGQSGIYAGSTKVGYISASGVRKEVYAAAFDFSNAFSTEDAHGGYTFDFLVERYIPGFVGNDTQIVGLALIDKETV